MIPQTPSKMTHDMTQVFLFSSTIATCEQKKHILKNHGKPTAEFKFPTQFIVACNNHFITHGY